MVRLLARKRRYASRDQYSLCALVHRQCRRQEARAAKLHNTSSKSDPLQGDQARTREASKETKATRLRGAQESPIQFCPGGLKVSYRLRGGEHEKVEYFASLDFSNIRCGS